jgi:hypothetical protein
VRSSSRSAHDVSGRRSVGVALAIASAVASSLPSEPAARAEPVHVDATDTAVGAYRGTNRDSLPDNDNYYELLNRLGVQLTWWRLLANLRLDSAVYVEPPTPSYLASNAVAPEQRARNCDLTTESLDACYNRQLLTSERALLNRYRTTIYPSKVSLAYLAPHLEVTVGDFYAQFGRGLTLSIRKIDEFAYDTTLRGAKIDWNWQNGGGGGSQRLAGTLLLGYANPVRVDEISGRRLVTPGSWLFAGMPGPDGPGAMETFRPDGILGARIEGGNDVFVVGAYGSLLARGGLGQLVQADPASTVAFAGSGDPGRQAKYVETASASLSLPRIADRGAAYVEVATQRLALGSTPFGSADPAGPADVTGHALTGSVSFDSDRWQALIELRHTRRFSPLRANVDTLRASEFVGVQYSAPPTTEPVTTDTELNRFGECTTGGRARVDHRPTEGLIAYASLGLYRTWSERFGDCGASGIGRRPEDRNDVWDPLLGIIVTYNQTRSRANIWVGARFDQTALPSQAATGELTREFYREAYLRYDALHTLDSRFAVQMQGTHRARSEPSTDAASWKEGENYVALHWASRIIASFGYEYTTRASHLVNYFNGSVFYRLPHSFLPQDSSLRLFIGQQRGALRCVNGVCKVFPDFAGLRAELVVRF